MFYEYDYIYLIKIISKEKIILNIKILLLSFVIQIKEHSNKVMKNFLKNIMMNNMKFLHIKK